MVIASLISGVMRLRACLCVSDIEVGFDWYSFTIKFGVRPCRHKAFVAVAML